MEKVSRMVSSKILEIERFLKILEENSDSEILLKFEEIGEKWKVLEEFNPLCSP